MTTSSPSVVFKEISRLCLKVILKHLDVKCSLETTIAPHSSTLAWKIPWMKEPGRLQSMGLLRVRYDWATSLSLSCIGEGNGNPLECSCLENPRDGGAWWAAIFGVAQSRTRLKWLSISSSSDTWDKETEENNRMGKTRDLFNKSRDTKGTFHATFYANMPIQKWAQ